MARPEQHLLVAPMKTPQTIPRKPHRTGSQEVPPPQPEPVSWHRASLPQIGRRDPRRSAGEWRPGEASKRGYEKAVEDWWWL